MDAWLRGTADVRRRRRCCRYAVLATAALHSPRMSPPPQTSSFDVLIVGAGFAGLYMLHKARGMGLYARIIESAPSVRSMR
jgi:hypothetical protein